MVVNKSQFACIQISNSSYLSNLIPDIIAQALFSDDLKSSHPITRKTTMWTFPHYPPGKLPNWQALEHRFSWFADMKNVPQDPEWHAEGDVFVHTKMVCEALLQLPEFQTLSEQEQHILFAAAMLHDVEKRSTTKREIQGGKERIVSPNHAKKGEYTARSLLYTELATPFAVREAIAKLVRLHGLPLWAIDKPSPERAVIAASLQVNTAHLAMLAKADVLGRICRDQQDILLRIDLFRELCEENGCWGKARNFASDYGRYLYLNGRSEMPDYQPFDDRTFDVYAMCAIAGSGKDSYIRQHLAHLPMLSLDDIRRERKLDPADPKHTAEAVRLGKEQAKEYLRARTSFVFNATNLNRDLRSKWLPMFADYGARVHLIYLEVPYTQLLSQNRNREHSVPNDVIHRMINKLEIPDYGEANTVDFVVSE